MGRCTAAHRGRRWIWSSSVEFYAAMLLHGLGLPTELLSPTFAAGRVAGWIGHAREKTATGRHKAGLNFGDCFAYALARETGEPLLFKGDDFAYTDIVANPSSPPMKPIPRVLDSVQVY